MSVKSTGIEMGYNIHYGPCDLDGCSENASSIEQFSDGTMTKLCAKHKSLEVKRDTYDLYVEQQAQRERLSDGEGTPLIVMIDSKKNLDGQYVAYIKNPILSCSPGFGSTPQRALRDLALKLADEADRVLHRINEQEFEKRQLKEELGIADV